LLLSSFNLKSSLEAEVVAEEVDAQEEVAVPHVRVAGSRLRRLPLGQLLVRPRRARPLGRVLRAPRLVLGLLVVRQSVRGLPVVLPPQKRRKLALAPAAQREGKVLPPHSGQPEQVQMSRVAVRQLVR
jgi:hypothetical protein